MEGAKRRCVVVALREGCLGAVWWLWLKVLVHAFLLGCLGGRTKDYPTLWVVGCGTVVGLGVWVVVVVAW
jgi:hypothetical protein